MPAIDQTHDLLGGDRGGYEVAGLLVVLQAFEAVAEPVRHARARLLSEAPTCLKLWMGMMPGTMGMVMPRSRTRSR